MASAEFLSALANHGVVTFGHAQDEFLSQGVTGGGLDLFASGVGTAVADVVGDGVVEQESILGDDADFVAERIEAAVAQRSGVTSG